MRTILFPAAALLLGLAACSGSDQGSPEAIDTIDLKGETIIPYDSLNQPYGIYVTDSKLYLVNAESVDTLIEEYTLDGDFVRRFLTKGNGPDEVPFIYSIKIDPYHKQFDIVTAPNNLECLTLEGVPALENLFSFEIPEGTDNSDLNESQPMPGGGMLRLADGSILSGNMSRGGLLALYAPDGSFRQFVAPYLPKSEYGDGIPDYMVFNFMQPNIAVSPDGRHFAANMGVADYTVFGELSGDSLKIKTKFVAPPTGINVVVGNGWSSFNYADNYIIPVKFGPIMSSGRTYIGHNALPEQEYMVLAKKMSTGEIPAETILSEYDFDGNLVGAVRIDAMPKTITVSPDGKTFYAIVETEEDGIVVKRYIR